MSSVFSCMISLLCVVVCDAVEFPVAVTYDQGALSISMAIDENNQDTFLCSFSSPAFDVNKIKRANLFIIQKVGNNGELSLPVVSTLLLEAQFLRVVIVEDDKILDFSQPIFIPSKVRFEQGVQPVYLGGFGFSFVRPSYHQAIHDLRLKHEHYKDMEVSQADMRKLLQRQKTLRQRRKILLQRLVELSDDKK